MPSKRRKLKIGAFYFFKFLDHTASATGESGPCEIHAAGWLVEETPHHYVLACWKALPEDDPEDRVVVSIVKHDDMKIKRVELC